MKRLESAGFVRREIDATDLRRHELTLAPQGREVMTRGQALLADAMGRRLARLTGPQRAEFKALLEKLA